MSGEASAKDLMVRLWDTSERLKSAGIWHEIRGFRQDGVSILAHVPGEYWEIDFLEDELDMSAPSFASAQPIVLPQRHAA